MNLCILLALVFCHSSCSDTSGCQVGEILGVKGQSSLLVTSLTLGSPLPLSPIPVWLPLVLSSPSPEVGPRWGSSLVRGSPVFLHISSKVRYLRATPLFSISSWDVCPALAPPPDPCLDNLSSLPWGLWTSLPFHRVDRKSRHGQLTMQVTLWWGHRHPRIP